jgi:ribosome-associated protein
MVDNEENEIDDEEEYFDEKAAEQAERAEVEEIAKKLVLLENSDFQHISLDPDLRKEIETARNINSHKAKRRQIRAVVKTILEHDFDAVREALLGLSEAKLKANSRFKEIEKWRDKIILGDKDAIENVIAKYSSADRQHLRNLQRNAIKEKTIEGKARIAKSIFQYIRGLEVN